MKDTRAVPRYARALFETGLASDVGAHGRAPLLDNLEKDFLRVRELVTRHPEISHLVLNSTIAAAEKEDFIDKIVPADVAPVMVIFLKVLIKKRRFRELADIQQEFHRLYEKKRGVQEIEVVTAAPLSGTAEIKLTAALRKKLRAEIRLVAKTDPAVIGGMILRFDGTEINSSFRDRLLEIRQRLMES